MTRRFSLRRSFAVSALVLVCAFGSSSRAASIDENTALRLALPQKTGFGAWMIAGPIADTGQVSSRLHPGLGFVDGQRWRPLLHAEGPVDWIDALGPVPGKVQAAVLGTWLTCARPFDGFLLLGADGLVRVAVDGQWVYVRRIPGRASAIEPIPLKLDSGQHRILVVLERQNHRTSFYAELRDGTTGLVPDDVDVLLPHPPAARELFARLVQVRWTLDVSRLPVSLELQLSTPSGAPRQKAEVQVSWTASRDTAGANRNAGSWDLSATTPFVMRLEPFDGISKKPPSEFTVSVNDVTFTRKVRLSNHLLEVVADAIQLRERLKGPKTADDPFDAIVATLDDALDSTATALFDETAERLERSEARLMTLMSRLRDERSPFASPGWIEAAIRSPYDGRPQPVLVQVPEQHAPNDAPWPLVVLLHGYNGSPRSVLEAFLDDPGPNSKVPGIVIAPEAHGNAFYRGAGERAVYDAIEWAKRTYSVDPERISITGVSMGGTGTAELAFRHSSTFAAAAPLCGYQSYFVRRDTANRAVRPWERHLMHLFSPASHADCGHDIPLYVAHGTKDLPLVNSRVLTTRYEQLNQTLVQDWPALGHAVWKKTYHAAGLFPWLTQWRKDLDPPYISVTTGLLRHARKFWVEITEMLPTTELSHLDVRADRSNHLTVHTQSVAEFCLYPSAHVDGHNPITVTVDGQVVELPPTTMRCFHTNGATWQVNSPPAVGLKKRPFLEGPWSDLLAEPTVVVYGAQNPQTAALNRWVAERLFAAKPGVTLQIPVVSDNAYAATPMPQTRAVYVGRPDDHLQLSKIATRLPIRITGNRIELGETAFTGDDLGSVFVYPDPERPTRLLGIVTATGPKGLLRALSLPALVPDFIVFDQAVAAAAQEPILGPLAFVRAAGFFRSDWSLPSNLVDPFAKERPRSTRP